MFPLKGKRAFQSEWYKHARATKNGIAEYAKIWKGHNYGVLLDSVFVLDVDIAGAEALKREIAKLIDILGPFKPGFMVVTGKERFHIYCDAKGREIHSQAVTAATHIKGWHSYVVGPGSIHPETGKRYEICERDDNKDPRILTDLLDETLDRLAAKRIILDEGDTTSITFNVGTGTALELEHSPCIKRLMTRGAPADQEYVMANHTIARYVISAGLTDADGAAIAAEMAAHTPVSHPTTKDVQDKAYNFSSVMASARNNPEANRFNCSYVWGSKELVAGGLCRDCVIGKQDEDVDVPADVQMLVRAKAIHELRKGDPFRYCFNTYQQSHASDVELGKVGLLSIVDQSVMNSIGIFPKATGGSGKGKTSGKTAVVHLVPPKYVFKRSFSDKALFYIDLPSEAILFFDDRTLSEGMEELIRCVMDDFQSAKKHTTVHEGKSYTMDIPPRCLVMFTNVDSVLNIQTANRTVDVTVDESAEADEAVHMLTIKRAEKGAPKYPLTFEVMVCREIFRIIKEEIGPFRVAIPYARFINWPGKDNRRNFDIFCDFIRGFAAFRCMQRQTREGVVFADNDDFHDAVTLYRSLSKTQTSKLTEREWLVLQAIFDNGKSATMKELVETLKPYHLRYYTIRDIIKGRKNRNSGLLDKVDGLTVTSVHDTSQGGNDTDVSRSTNEELFSLPYGFNIMAMYDSGGAIILAEEAHHIDLDALDIWKPVTALTHVDAALTGFCKSDEKVEIPSAAALDDIIAAYKEQLQQQTTALTIFSERAGQIACDQETSQANQDIRDSSSSLDSPVKVPKRPISKAEKDGEIARTQNNAGIDVEERCPHPIKATSKQASDVKASGNIHHQLVKEVRYCLESRARNGKTVLTFEELETWILRDVLARDRVFRYTTEQIRAAIHEVSAADAELIARCIGVQEEADT
ncbi:MAG: bifunctional DNA primase/polymerase [Halobacteriota archaeon]